MLNRLSLAAATSILLIACQTNQLGLYGSGSSIPVKPGMSGARLFEDLDFCTENAKKIQRNTYSSLPYYGSDSLAGVLAAALIAGAADGFSEAQAKDDYRSNCLAGYGYVLARVPELVESQLDDAETKEERIGIIDRYVASPAFKPVIDWENTRKLDSIDSYEAHIAEFKESPFLSEAEKRISELQKYVPLAAQFRKNSSFTSQIEIRGLTGSGWQSVGAEFPCDSKVHGEFNFSIQMGVVTGELELNDRQILPLSGTFNKEGRLLINAGWPADDPLFVDGRISVDFGIDARLRSQQISRCYQFIWLNEVYEH